MGEGGVGADAGDHLISGTARTTGATDIRSAPLLDRIPDAVIFVALAAIAAALTLPYISDRPFWLDEAFTVANTRSGLLDTLGRGRGRMIAYYALVSPLVDAPLGSFTWLRLPSALATMCAPIVFFVTARRVTRPAIALASAILLALHPLVIEHGQEARAYTITLLLILVSWYSFIRLVEEPRRPWWAVLMAATLVVAGYFHLVAFAILPAQIASLLYLSSWRRHWRPVAWVTGAVAIAALPLAVLVLSPSAGRPDWIPPFQVSQIWTIMSLFGTGPHVVFRLAWLVAVGVGLALSLRPSSRPNDPMRSWLTAVPGAWLVVPIAIVAVMSFVNPLMHYRYVLITLPAFILLAALALDRVRLQSIGVAALALLGVGLVGSHSALVDAGANARQWPILGCALAEIDSADTVVFPEPRDRIPVDLAIEMDPSCTPDARVIPSGPWGVLSNEHTRASWDDVEIDDLSPQTWVVWRDLRLVDDLRQEASEDLVDAGYVLVETEAFGPDIEVDRWVLEASLNR